MPSSQRDSPRVRLAGAIGPWSHDLTALLSRPAFRQLWLSNCASSFTLWTEVIVTGWVALQLTGSPWLVAMTGVGRAVAMPLIGPLSGALADRLNCVLLVRIAEGGSLVALVLLAGTLLTGHGSYWLLLLVTLWFGVSTALGWPSRRALMMDLAGSEYLLTAVVLERVTQSVARVLGPLLAGALLALWADGAYAVLV
ncbi:MAG: MFS transporter, partial [Chloroflexota bacterium]|nr:MFS transporter [Chloroflexota bacterium]